MMRLEQLPLHWTPEYEAAPALRKIKKISEVWGFENVQFIILYGSVTQGNATPVSDIDICFYYNGPRDDASRFRFEVISQLGDRFDLQVFQQLPLYVRMEVLKVSCCFTGI
jgi:uncharacterized protein